MVATLESAGDAGLDRAGGRDDLVDAARLEHDAPRRKPRSERSRGRELPPLPLGEAPWHERIGPEVFAEQDAALRSEPARRLLRAKGGELGVLGVEPAEAEPFATDTLNGLLALADKGINDLVGKQRAVVGPILGR